MYQYQQVLRQIIDNGTEQPNRTGTNAIVIPAAMMQFDLRFGFPAVTTKKLAYAKGFGEMIGFLRGYDNKAQFEALGCDWWEADANKNSQWLASPHRKGDGDLGRIYGKQWRDWIGVDTSTINSFGDARTVHIDQLQVLLDTIRNNPTSRRIIMTGWNPAELDQMALPPCHMTYEFVVDVRKKELHMTMHQRSCDMFLGVPFNISNSALFLSLVAAATGYTPRTFTHFLTDAHIYVNHVDQVHEVLENTPLPPPRLILPEISKTCTADELAAIDPASITLEGYQSARYIPGEMSTG